MSWRRAPSVLVLVLVCTFTLALSGCARARNTAPSGPVVETTASVLEPTSTLTPKPSATPEAAVAAYLGIVQDAYFSLDSTLVAPFVTEGQWVREDAYIQLNLTQNQAMEMNLLEFKVTAQPSFSVESTSVALDASEHWQWRYWDLKTRKPKDEWVETTYSVRYTLERLDGGWLVGQTKVLEQSGDETPTSTP